MIRNLEYLKQNAPDGFLADFVETAWSWRGQEIGIARRPRSGVINTITELPPDPAGPSTETPAQVYWSGVLQRPNVLVDIGAQASPTGLGGLARTSTGWVYKDFATKDEVLGIFNDSLYNWYHAPSHQWDGRDPLVGQQIAGLLQADRPTWAGVILDSAAPAPTTRVTGQLYWDADDQCVSATLAGTDTTLQVGFEDLLRAQNKSGSAMTNGQPGYIMGASGNRPEIGIARADDKVKSKAIVLATEGSIADSNTGYWTTRGLVHDLNNAVAEGSEIWLQTTGGFGSSKPSPNINHRNVSLGTSIRQHATNGHVFANIHAIPFLDEISGVGIAGLLPGHQLGFNGTYWQNEPGPLHRFPINNDGTYNLTLSYNPVNRILTMTPTGASFVVWINGVKYTFSGAQSFPAHTTAEKTFCYINASGALEISTTPFNLLAVAPVAIIYWDAVQSTGFAVPELHTTRMSARTHERLHEVQGAEAGRRSGFAISGYTYNLDTVAGVTFGISGGKIWDEDIPHTIPTLADGSTYTILFRTGASGSWTWNAGSTLPYKTGTNYATANVFSGGAWTQQELDGAGTGQFMNMFAVAMPNLNIDQLVLVQGQGVFTTQALAEAQTWDTLDAGTLPSMEMPPLYQIILKSNVSFGAVTKKTEIVLIKKVGSSSGGAAIGGPTVHNSLSGRSDVDTHPFSSLSGVLGNTQFPALSGDVSNTVGTVAVTVNRLSGQALPAFGATPANFRWNGSAWTMDTTAYAPNSSLGNYVLKSGDTMTGNLAINAVTAGWSEGIRIIAASGAWGGLRLSRNNLTSSTDGNWAFGYANNATSDFEIDVQQGASQFKWGKFYKSGGGVVNGAWAVTDTLRYSGGIFRDLVQAPTLYSAFYGSGVTPGSGATYNYSLALKKDGVESWLSGTTSSHLAVNGVYVVRALAAGAQVAGTLSSTGHLTAPSATIGSSTAILKRTAGVLGDAVAVDFPTLNQSTTGNAATSTKWASPINLTIGATGKSLDGSGALSYSFADIFSLPSGRVAYGSATTGLTGSSNFQFTGSSLSLGGATTLDIAGLSAGGLVKADIGTGTLGIASTSFLRGSLAMPNKEVVFGSTALGVSSSSKFLFDGNNASLSGGSKFYFGGELGGGNIYQSFDNVRISSDLNITSPRSTDGNGSIVFNVDDGNSVVNIARFESGGIGYTGGPNAIFESHVYVEKTLNCIDEINMLGDVYLDQEIVTASTYTLPDVPARATKQIIFNVTSCDVSTGTQGVSLRRDDGSLGNEAAGTVIAASFGKTGNRMRSILLVGVTSTMASIIG